MLASKNIPMSIQEMVSSAPEHIWENLSTIFPNVPSLHIQGQFPWSILIALIILMLAHSIKYFINTVVEDEHTYLGAIGIFFILYIVAALAINTLNPVIAAGS